jgi:hypothetical protein
MLSVEGIPKEAALSKLCMAVARLMRPSASKIQEGVRADASTTLRERPQPRVPLHPVLSQVTMAIQTDAANGLG